VILCEISKQIVQECLWEGTVRMISDPVNIFAEHLKYIFILSEHKEQTLNTLEAFFELVFRLTIENTLGLSKL
jgi:hypothetical protein